MLCPWRPANATNMLIYQLYKDGFQNFNPAGAAQSLILFVFVVVLTLPNSNHGKDGALWRLMQTQGGFSKSSAQKGGNRGGVWSFGSAADHHCGTSDLCPDQEHPDLPAGTAVPAHAYLWQERLVQLFRSMERLRVRQNDAEQRFHRDRRFHWQDRYRLVWGAGFCLL